MSVESRKTNRHVIIGGGVAGVTCAEQLSRLRPDDHITLLSASPLLKGVSNIVHLSRFLEKFEIVERTFSHFAATNVHVERSFVQSVDVHQKLVISSDGQSFPYDYLCVASGGRPKMLCNSPYVVGIRDTESLEVLQQKLSSTKRAIVVGNGGIALELVHALSRIPVTWVIKDRSIGHSFFDASAAAFFLDDGESEIDSAETVVKKGSEREGNEFDGYYLTTKTHTKPLTEEPFPFPVASQPPSASVDVHSAASISVSAAASAPRLSASAECSRTPSSYGSAVGPDWVNLLLNKAPLPSPSDSSASVCSSSTSHPLLHIESGCEIKAIATIISSLSDEGVDQMTGYQVVYGEMDVPKDVNKCSSSFTYFASSFLSSLSPLDAKQSIQWPVIVELTNGQCIGCDIIISATGVLPALDFMPAEAQRSKEDGGLDVNEDLMTTCEDVFAAGDACSIHWADQSPHWFQMRLWSQAKMEGLFVANRMAMRAQEHDPAEEYDEDKPHSARRRRKVSDLDTGMCFELFAHTTQFFGHKIVLLGDYQAQGLEGEYQTMTRILRGRQYIRLVLQNGRLQGALCIGETDLEETFENLILNQINISDLGEAILDPDIDVEDYFD